MTANKVENIVLLLYMYIFIMKRGKSLEYCCL